MENICKNCGDVISKNYCGNCGSKYLVEKINGNYALQELLNLVGFEKGFLYTSKELLFNPGSVIREYINENRQKITKPITYLILTSVIYTLISQYFSLDIVYSDFYKKNYGESSLANIIIWIQENMGYANILAIFPVTIWANLFFKNYKYNFYEVFVVISLIMGFGMLIFSLEPPIDMLFPEKMKFTNSITALIAFLYAGWAIGEFYGRSLKNYIKAFLTYILGFITFQIAIIIIAIVIDVIFK